MAFHRHTGKVDVLPGVVGEALCVWWLVNGEGGFANRLLHQQKNSFECSLQPQPPAAVPNDGKWAYNQCGGLAAVVAASSVLQNALAGKCFCICCCGKAGAQLLSEED